MFDLPLHPIAVHFPIVLGVGLPFVALAVIWGIKKEILRPRVWALVTAVALVYGASAWLASELGENDEDKVEKVISEEVIEEHEEAAELVAPIAGGLVLVSLAGLVLRRAARARWTFVVLSFIALAPLMNAGHTGGELVYKHGAALAHLSPQARTALLAAKGAGSEASAETHEGGEHGDD